MIFADMEDSHDRRASKLIDADDEPRMSDGAITNFNLVGIRRRLNNIEVGVWLIVVLLGANLFKAW
jgi:hypothetical protein